MLLSGEAHPSAVYADARELLSVPQATPLAPL